MAHQGKTLKIVSAQLHEVEPWLRLIEDDDFAWLPEQLADCRVFATLIELDGAEIGALILSRLTHEGRTWLHVNGLAANAPRGFDLIGALRWRLQKLAQAAGLEGVMIHTRRRGLVRKLKSGTLVQKLNDDPGRYIVEARA